MSGVTKALILVELLKQGDGARSAATDLKALEAVAEQTNADLKKVGETLGKLDSSDGAKKSAADIRNTQNAAGSLNEAVSKVRDTLGKLAQSTGPQVAAQQLRVLQTNSDLAEN